MSKKFNQWLLRLQQFVDRPWYIPFIALLAGLDLFIMIVPTDWLLISAVMLRPKRWISCFIWVTLGSVVGAVALGYVMQLPSNPISAYVAEKATSMSAWKGTAGFMERNGTWTLGLVALSPLPQQPAVMIAALTGMQLTWIAVAVLIGRATKYSVFSWLASHAPRLLNRIGSVRREMDSFRPQLQNPKGEVERKHDEAKRR